MTKANDKTFQCDLWLSKIVYSGDNIGHNFSLKFSLNHKSCSLKINNLKYDDINDIYHLLFSQEYQKEETSELHVKIAEIDDIPDTNSSSIKLTLAKNTGIAGNLTIKVIEQGPNGSKKAEAILTLVFLTRTYELGLKSLTSVDEDGWIIGYYINPQNYSEYGSKVSFPYGMMVRLYKVLATHNSKGFQEKECFEILEGHKTKDKKNRHGRLLMCHSAKSRFSKIKYNSSAKLEFIITEEKFPNYCGKLIVYSGKQQIITVNAITANNRVCLNKGTYNLRIPDEPHKGGLNYQYKIPHSKTWFRIENAKNQEVNYYLHYGEISAGCITVIAPTNSSKDLWEPIYQYLITCRNKNQEGVIGTIKVLFQLKKQ